MRWLHLSPDSEHSETFEALITHQGGTEKSRHNLSFFDWSG